MPYEKGGRADKNGNKYEIRWVIYQILRVLEEKIYSVTLEALGNDEQGVDVWIVYLDGTREGQQCKGRNGSLENWTISSAKAHDIFANWKVQLDRNSSDKVSLVSPLSFSLMTDLIDRANNTDGNPKHFYNYQILKSGKKFINFYEEYALAMKLNPQCEVDLVKSIDYLKRTFYRQSSDTELKETILDKIRYLLVGNENEIYDAFVHLVIDGNILGRPINNTFLCNFLSEKEVKLKSLALDKRIFPRIIELNKEYRKFFISINEKLINRNEFNLCRDSIDLGESIIIHGKAGNGKSGCTESIIDYCEENLIPFIAIKLDKRIPSGNAEKWGQDLGLPASIAHCLHSISKHEKAAIILDQLDALRWTQSHSRDSLLVCSEIINEVIKINRDRKKKISIVFVCRTYDLENDNNIKALFKTDDSKTKDIVWSKIYVDEFDDSIVKEVVGERYERLSHKLKSVLKIPSNLYIWQQLSPNKEYDECLTTSHLIFEWWKQLKSKCLQFGIDEMIVNQTKERIVQLLDKIGRINISKRILNTSETALVYLSSNGFLIVQNDSVSFAHQSILDYFLAEEMLQKFYNGENIINIIGDKGKQTPGRRYQVQMLLQNLVEMNSKDFIDAGEQMLMSDNIRYYVKHVFYEILSQINNIDQPIKKFIIQYCEDKKYEKYILNDVLNGHPDYIRILRDNNILDKWMQNKEQKDVVFNLLVSMHPDYDCYDVIFIRKYAFKSQADDEKLFRCFWNDINKDTDEMFELRMEFYNHYPEMAGEYLDFRAMFKNCEMRTIRIFEFLLNWKIKRNGKSIYKYEEELLGETSEILLVNGTEILNKLLPCVPKEIDDNLFYSDWNGKYRYKNEIERTCVQIIKKANAAIIFHSPNKFFEIYNEYMGKGYPIFNEIILDSLSILPNSYSDCIINYLCESFEQNIFDKTSGNGDELLLAKSVITKHSAYCNNDVFSLLEENIIHYISPRAKEWYSSRIEFNKSNSRYIVYWSFWGDLQSALLPCLSVDRMSEKAKKLLSVLQRRFAGEKNRYQYSNGHSGWVSSPISNKKLSNKKWLEILTNEKLKDRRNSHWKEVIGGFIESSIEEFSISFREATLAEPKRMIELVLGCKKKVMDAYINSLFSGVAFSQELNDISIELLETMIVRYSYDYKSQRADYICSIIEKRKDVNWSQKILNILKDIAVNHINPELSKPNVTSNDDKEMQSFDMMQSNALNCVRGAAARAIAHLLWENNKLYTMFKETIEKIMIDVNPAVKLASLYALWPVYNIERDWAAEKILGLYEQDYRFAGFHGSKNMFFLLYSEYKKRILLVIKKCFLSQDKELIKIGSYSLAEMFILKNEFSDEIHNIDKLNKEQAQSILHMAIIYFNKDEYNDISKDIIYRFKLSRFDLEFPVSRLFYDNMINLERDREFLIDIMKSGMSRQIIHAFVKYLEENSKSIVDYKDIILSMSYHLINEDYNKMANTWGIGDEISKLIIGLYDETSVSSQSELIDVSKKCLNIWDLMFEKQVGSMRILSQKIFER